MEDSLESIMVYNFQNKRFKTLLIKAMLIVSSFFFSCV